MNSTDIATEIRTKFAPLAAVLSDDAGTRNSALAATAARIAKAHGYHSRVTSIPRTGTSALDILHPNANLTIATVTYSDDMDEAGAEAFVNAAAEALALAA